MVKNSTVSSDDIIPYNGFGSYSFMIKSVMVVAIVSKETLARTSLWNIVREMLSCLFCM